jgi:hypothetical protein
MARRFPGYYNAAGAAMRRPCWMLTKSTDCPPLKKAARQGDEPAKKGFYPVVNDRILQATPTRQAENPSDLECVSKMRHVQFRVDLPAVQGDFPQA